MKSNEPAAPAAMPRTNEAANRRQTIQLFDDIPRYYHQPKLNAQTTYDFYNKSALPSIAKIREMLQRWNDRARPSQQREMASRMRGAGSGKPNQEQQFAGAFFELCMHEFLRGADGDVVPDPKIGALKPDFGVTEVQPDGARIDYIVECKVVDIMTPATRQHTWNEREALDILNTIESPDFKLFVETEGALTTAPKRNDLKAPFEQLVADLQYDDVHAIAELDGYNRLPTAEFEHEGWKITGQAMPVPREKRPHAGRFIAAGPSQSFAYDDIGTMKNAAKEKAGKYAELNNLIIALSADDWNRHAEEALYGNTCLKHYRGTPLYGKDMTLERINDGFWDENAPCRNAHVLGVVIFHKLWPHCIDRATATFYANPHNDKPLPKWTQEIDYVTLKNGEAVVTPGKKTPAHFIRDHEPFESLRFPE